MSDNQQQPEGARVVSAEEEVRLREWAQTLPPVAHVPRLLATLDAERAVRKDAEADRHSFYKKLSAVMDQLAITLAALAKAEDQSALNESHGRRLKYENGVLRKENHALRAELAEARKALGAYPVWPPRD